MTIIKRVDPVSLAKLQGIIMALVGLVAALLMTLVGSLAGALFSSFPEAENTVSTGGILALGAGAIIFLPIAYGVAGFVGGLIGGLIYNLVAKWVGGIELELQEKK